MAGLSEEWTLYVKIEIKPEDRALLENIRKLIDQTGIAPAIAVRTNWPATIQTKEDKKQ